MILIVGGTGSLGSATARRLLARGRPVRVMTRSLPKAAELQKLGAQIVQGNLLDRESLARACCGVEKMLAAAHSIMGRGRNASKHVDLQGHKDLVDAAKAAGVRHFVYTSAYRCAPEYDTVPFFRFKREVERFLQASRLNYTILRPTAFMDSHAEMFIGKPILENRVVSLFGKGENPRNFVAADDVAQFAVIALEDASLNGLTVDIGGPENLTNMGVVRLYERLTGRRAKVNHVPLGVLRVLVHVLRPLHPGRSQVLQAGIYTETVNAAFDPAPLLAAHPITLTRLDDWAAQRVTPP
jgi:uncharacterized protein YbjT (DUF2867 family)